MSNKKDTIYPRLERLEYLQDFLTSRLEFWQDNTDFEGDPTPADGYDYSEEIEKTEKELNEVNQEIKLILERLNQPNLREFLENSESHFRSHGGSFFETPRIASTWNRDIVFDQADQNQTDQSDACDSESTFKLSN